MGLNTNHLVSYGHGGLTRTISKPIENKGDLERTVGGIGKAAGSSQQGPAQDTQGAYSSLKQQITSAVTLLEGVISYVFPGAYSYRVMLAGNLGTLVCSDARNASFMRSVRISQLYPVGTHVVVMKQSTTKGVIMGTPSRISRDTIYSRAIISSGIGSFHANNRKYVKKISSNLDTARGFPNYAQGRSGDICEGEYHISNMMEGGFYTGPYETSVRQAWDCGVWMHTFDKLLKLVGRSVQEYSVAHEKYAGMDESEPYVYEGVASWPWEALGYYRKPTEELFEEKKANEVVYEEKGISFQEPAKPDAEPFYRFNQYRGFLGQGETREVHIPPPDVSKSPTEDNIVHTLDDEDNIPLCVARQQIQADGTILQESAKGIYSIKQVNIRSYKRKRRIEDPKGDDQAEGNYKTEDLDLSKSPPKGETDEILNVTRNKAVATFRHHEEDFVAAEGDKQLSETDVELYPDLNVLARYGSVESPPPVKARVDEVYKDAEYHKGRSVIAQLANGDIILRNAFGAEIALRGSNIELSAPGDLRLMFGRSVISLAGDDTILRSKNSIDLTSTSKDVRVKAEYNLDMVGGVGGRGRTLLENQASGTPVNQDVQGRVGETIIGRGLILKAKNSTVATIGKHLYQRSLDAGSIIVDADEGKGFITVNSRMTRIHGSSQVHIAASIDDTQRSNVLIVRPSATISKGMIECHGAILAKGSIQSDTGVIVDPMMNFQLPPEYPRDKQIQDQVSNFRESGTGYLEQYYYAEDRLGHKATIDNYTFSYRDDYQYGASRADLKKPFWMELYGEEICSSLSTWQEPTYTYQDAIPQQPWPGHQAWSTESTIETKTATMYDAEQSCDKDEPEESTGATSSSKATPDDYLRIINPA